jgi:hypothetical protein
MPLHRCLADIQFFGELLLRGETIVGSPKPGAEPLTKNLIDA